MTRTTWYAKSLAITDEPLAKAMIKYRRKQDRERFTAYSLGYSPNLISSITVNGKHMPILDLDFPHHIVQSTTNDHVHIFFDGPEISFFRWFMFMWGSYLAGIIEPGYFWWSLRRRGNFVRYHTKKSQPEEFVKPTYGWFRKLK